VRRRTDSSAPALCAPLPQVFGGASQNLYGVLAVLVAVLAIPLAAVVVVRLLGGLLLRHSPERHRTFERQWLWAIVPATAIYLSVLGVWPLAIAWVVLSTVAVILLKRTNYMGMQR